MSLSQVVIETRNIKFKGGEFSLSGLTFNELTGILLRDGDEVSAAYKLFEKHAGPNVENGEEGMQKFGLALVNLLPDLTAKLIAASCGEPEAWAVARKLPAPIQTEALVAIAQLTFEEPAAVKKFIENLILAAKASSDTMAAVETLIPNALG
jgi:hypothetical protein